MSRRSAGRCGGGRVVSARPDRLLIRWESCRPSAVVSGVSTVTDSTFKSLVASYASNVASRFTSCRNSGDGVPLSRSRVKWQAITIILLVLIGFFAAGS